MRLASAEIHSGDKIASVRDDDEVAPEQHSRDTSS
jgi:hypothetical protein